MKNQKNQDYLSENVMQINNEPCWKCGKLMKIAFIMSKGVFFGPEGFNKQQLELAKSKGVLIKRQDSKTSKETYLANTCPDCGAFIGQFFIHEYLGSDGERYKLD